MNKKRVTVIAAAGAAVLLALGGVGAFAAIQGAPTPEPTSTQVSTIERVVPSPSPTPIPVVVEAPVVEPEPAPVVVPAEPVRCPEGTTANAVDDVGNESNCQANNSEDQPCVAYDDNNNCTAYYKP